MLKHHETVRLIFGAMVSTGSIALTVVGLFVWIVGGGILGLNPYSQYLAVILIIASIYIGAHRAIGEEREAKDTKARRVVDLEAERAPRLTISHDSGCPWCSEDQGNTRFLRVCIRNSGLPAIQNPLISVRVEPDPDHLGEQALAPGAIVAPWVIRHSLAHGGNEDHVNLLACFWQADPIVLHVVNRYGNASAIRGLNYRVTIIARADGVAEAQALFTLVYDAQRHPILQPQP